MKRFIFKELLVIILIVSNIACVKEKSGDADAFVGTYNVSTIENVVWGSGSGTLADNGILYISKISSTRVKASGYFNTEGEVVGKSLYLNSKTDSDPSFGTITTSFSEGILNGNVLTISTVSSGQLGENGVLYPYRATAQHTCIKQ